MTRVLCLSDSQLGAGRTLAQDRLADQEAVLDQVAELAEAEGVDLVLHCGDVFDSRHPSEEARLVFKRWLSKVPVRVITLAGNHCLRGTAVASAVDLYDECEFVREPDVLDIGFPAESLKLACLPWAPPGYYVASQNGGDRDEANAGIAEALVDVARGLREECGEGLAILALHWWISGATTATGYGGNEVIREPVIPLADLEALGFDYVVAGHVHKSQLLATNPTEPEMAVFYCGAPMLTDWGEEKIEHGVWLIATASAFGVPRFVPLEDPHRFLTVDVDLTVPPVLAKNDGEGLDETDHIAAAIAEHFPLTEAVVRLRVKATAEQWRRVELHRIRGLCADAGVHRLIVAPPEIERTERARVEGMTTSLSKMEALELWLEVNA